MAIQFFCTACGQPIEVDDNMANLAVTCPYCQKVVTAPPKTDLTARPQPPAPSPIGGPLSPTVTAPTTSGLEPTMPTGVALGPPPKRTVVGWISLGCMLLSIIISVCVSLATMAMMKDLHPGSLTPAQMPEFQKEVAKRAGERPGLQIATYSGACILPVAAVVLAIAALVTGGRPRWPAITTLVILGLGIVAMCAGVLISAGARAGGG